MTDTHARVLDRELKKGSAELLILSLVEARPRHGYEISKLIESRSNGTLKFNVASLCTTEPNGIGAFARENIFDARIRDLAGALPG